MAYDLSDPEFLADPMPTLDRMRSEGALVQVKLPFIGKTWMTTTDAAARAVLKTPDIFIRNPYATSGKTLAQKFWYFPPFMKPLFQNMLGYDGDAHKRLRGLVDKAFNRVAIDDMRPGIAAIADGLLDRIDTSQSVDIIANYTRPLPLMAICELLGVPPSERDKVAGWIAPLSGPTTTWAMLRGFPGLWRIMRYFRADFERVRATPRAGLITDLVAVEDNGDRLSDDELLAMVVTLFIAGHETTVHLITMGIYGLLTHREERAALRERPNEVPLLVEEFMRFYSPVMMTKPLFTQKDTVVEGVPLKKGDQVAALLIAANHDSARFQTPETLVPDRRPNAHLGFGHGPHVCLGMQLARAEAQVAITRLLDRFPDVALARPDAPPEYTRRTGIRGLKQLKLRLD
ncbi:cytochrome P450 [Yoonia sp. 2307UL14-13]|uniref:cytochrome P450 n=1 Tax=Yoonia sp. 2307UL14-13 TaxID=3126506 RepID=UPI0030A71009